MIALSIPEKHITDAKDTFHGSLHLRNEWTGFDLVKVGLEASYVHRSGNLCPMRQKANFDTTIGGVEHTCAPPRTVTFIAPTAMSRYEGVRQIGTSLVVRDDSKMLINFCLLYTSDAADE